MKKAKKETLAEWFGVNLDTITAWLAAGLPDLEIPETEAWLIENGFAEPPEETVSTQADIAKLLSVSAVTANTYRFKPDFPSGPPWRVKDVLEWYEQTKYAPKNSNAAETKSERLAELKIEAAIRKEQREAGELIAIEEVVEEMTRQNVLAKQKIKRLVPMLLALLPPDTDERVVADYRQRAGKILDDAFDDLATAFRDEDE